MDLRLKRIHNADKTQAKYEVTFNAPEVGLVFTIGEFLPAEGIDPQTLRDVVINGIIVEESDESGNS